jgi:hypothetical protein
MKINILAAKYQRKIQPIWRTMNFILEILHNGELWIYLHEGKVPLLDLFERSDQPPSYRLHE